MPSNLSGNLDVIYRAYLQSQSIQVPNRIDNGSLALEAADYRANATQDAQGRMNVLVHLQAGANIDAVAQALTAKGLQVSGKSTRYRDGVIDAWVRVEDVAMAARTKGVRSVALSIAPIFNIGSVTQQGVVQHRVNNVAQDGTGITIGALSDSYNFSTAATPKAPADVLSGDLPGPGNPLGNVTPVSVIDESIASTDNDEGRAMLQLIHDMAPKARLGFATAGASKLQFADNIRSLAALPGAPRISPDGFKADIIVDDVIFLDEPMFSDGIVAQGVNDVNAAGVHYFSSAGNQPSSQGYASDFRYVDPNNVPPGQGVTLTAQVLSFCTGGFHNFRTDGTTSITQTLRRTGSTTTTSTTGVQFMLQWDDPFDKLILGTLTSTQTGTYAGTAQDFFITANAGVPMRLAVTADAGSAYDAIVTLTDPNGVVLVTNQDTDVDETLFFVPTVTGSYKVTLTSFGGTVGAFTIQTFENSTPGITTDYNVILFRADTGAPVSITATDNVGFNEPYEFKTSFSFGAAGLNAVKMAVCRKATANPQANRFRYVFFSTAIVPGEYVGYQYPMTYGHSTARDAHGVAAYSAFRPYIPESFTSPGPSTIVLDANGDRLVTPEIRQQPTVAAMDGGNNTFFLNASQDSASDADTFPNFFGTSAAAPNAAAIGALVLQAHGGPGSLTVAQMKSIMRNSAIPNDLDPYFAQATIHTNGGTLNIAVNADSSNSSAAYPLGPLDLNVIKASYTGSGSVASINFNSPNANTTGGDVNTVFPGLAFDTRAATLGGLPFTLGTLVGLVSGNVTPSFSNQGGSPSVAGQFQTMTLTFAPGSFTGGRSLTFNVDRDEQHTSSLSAPATAGGNSADLWGASVEIPAATVTPGGMTVTGTMSDGTTFSGTFVNTIGTGYSPLSGYGFLNAQRAVALASTTTVLTANIAGTGGGTVTSVPAGISCLGTCVFDFTTGVAVTLTATPVAGSVFSGFTGCDGATLNNCFILSLMLPRTIVANFTAMTAPDSPVITNVTGGNGQATVFFAVPGYDGGSPITGYTASCTPGPVSQSGVASPITVSSLANGTAYSCSVVATNAIGNSPPSGSMSVTPRAPVSPTRGDFDADGHGDIVVHNVDGRTAVWLMNGATITASAGVIGAGTAWQVAHIADLNGDGKSDLVWQNPDGRVTIYGMNGTTAAPKTQILNAGGGWTVTQAGDLDGDGKADLVFQNADGSIAAWLMNGASLTAGATLLGPGTGWSVTKVADFDGDGKMDLLFTHTDGRVAIWLMNGLTPTGTGQILNAGSGWSVIQTADLDGDGKADIVWQHTDGSVAVWLMNGTAMASGAGLLGAGTGWSVTRTGDFDGDGKADLFFTHTDGRAAIYLMSGVVPTTTTQILNAGTGWSAKRIADLNGDGKSDIVWEHTDGRVAVWIMSGTTMTSGAEILGPGTGWSVSPVSQ